MKKTIGFHSVLAEQMQQFVAFKRMQGYDYTSQARTLSYFDRFLVEIAADLNGLDPGDVIIECVLGSMDSMEQFLPRESLPLSLDGSNDRNEHLFRIDLCAAGKLQPLSGLEHFKIRIYPYHPLLSHRFACGRMLWL